ncbi:pyroglutamyl-peptidase I [Streptomyces zagrosensis]|uniref:Pyrrolidone-carboxylate peptidase n=1 Tax=Streptomyces zagrosensis TaxID=1042984 RepID=A0A7W9Q8Y8_9ACTN|nr:pyroglutamyl-peptidase I [Streptomyces zagrosensis]MBB5935323.1 pyroglutamyl-peptidase [Streptomyces zagrosensis]
MTPSANEPHPAPLGLVPPAASNGTVTPIDIARTGTGIADLSAVGEGAAWPRRVLLTGFEPFGGEPVNPSWTAVQLAVKEPLAGVEFHTAELPCVFGAALDALHAAVEAADPDVVLCVGQAGGRTDITVERLAINVDDARIPDNAGAQPIDEPVIPGGPAGYFAALPVKACVAAAREAGVPASVSQTAGTFVCNHVFYGLMHLIATERPTLRGGFVHVPYAPEQVLDRAAPALPAASGAAALRAIVATAVVGAPDLRAVGGATH